MKKTKETILKIKNHINEICKSACKLYDIDNLTGEVNLSTFEVHFFNTEKTINIKIDYFNMGDLPNKIKEQLGI